MKSSLDSKLIIITSLDGGSGDFTRKVNSIEGVGSARLHLRPMFRAAQKLALNPRLLSLDVDQPQFLSRLGEPDICVIGKLNHSDDSRVEGFAMASLAAVARLKANNVRIALMYCDHLAPLNCVRGSLYRDLLTLCDQVIVPCQALADRVKGFIKSSTRLSIIEDPWQTRMQKFHVPKQGSPLRIGWFGSANNIIFLCEKLRRLMLTIDVPRAIELVVLSNDIALKFADEAFKSSLPFALRPWKLQLVRWDDSIQPHQLEDVLGSVHVVWLPSEPRSPIKGGVSHNRLVDGLRSGAIVVADNMQSYNELRQLALLGTDHGQLINLLVPQYERLASKYDSLRSAALHRFSPEINFKSWQGVLAGMIAMAN